MQRFLVERRIRDVHDRLVRARHELTVLDEQYAVVSDAAEDARLRSLVSETPLAAHEYGEVKRHADAMGKARDALIASVGDLERRRDEAVSLAAETTPDLAILDVKMPGMSGIQAAREMTRDAKVAVMVLTAFSQRELIEEARDAGVAAYLVKPFRREELLNAVDTVLASCREEWAIDAEVESFGSGESAAEDKIATRRLVEEAKSALIQKSAMTEADAFSFIQRTAMRTRSRMREVARQVIEGSLSP
jgi:response regulator NasT